MLSIGTTAIVARSIGAGPPEIAGRAAMQSLARGVVISALRLLGASGTILDLADSYLLIVFSGSFTMVLSFMCNVIMRGAGCPGSGFPGAPSARNRTSSGVSVVAAYGIGLRIDPIVMMPRWAFGATASTLVGQNLGAGDALTPMLMRALGLLVVQIPAALLLPRAWDNQAAGGWTAIALASIVQGTGLAAAFAAGRWKQVRVWAAGVAGRPGGQSAGSTERGPVSPRVRQ